MISHIYFDWSGTLVKSDNMLRKTRKSGTCKILYPDTKLMLKYLSESGYTLGLITNSDKHINYLLKCLTQYGIRQYFKGAIVVASMKGMKEKPAPTMFHRALEIDCIDASNALMVGNKQSVDINGAKKAGLRAAIVDRLGTGPSGKEDIYVQNLLELGLYLF